MKNTTYQNLSKKDIWLYSIGTFVVLLGWVISFIGLFLPPPGEIHSSVLLVLGQSLVFGAAIFGVGYYVKTAIGEFKTDALNKILKKLDSKYPSEGETETEEDLERENMDS